MEFIKSWKFMAILIAVVFAIAVVGVVVGVITHTEPGLQPDVPRWARADFPLSVCVANDDKPDVGTHNDRLVNMMHAIDITNARLGFDVFRMTQGSECQVMVLFNVPYEAGVWDGPGGNSEIVHHGGRAFLCRIETSNVAGELLGLTLEHEFGHCLGLAHDDFASSIMRDPDLYPMRSTPSGQFPPRITDHDRELLRGMYAP